MEKACEPRLITMRHVELKKNLLVVARGEPARITEILLDAKIEVQLTDSHRKLIVDVEEIKFLPIPVTDTSSIGHLELEEMADSDDIKLEDLLKAKEQHIVIQRFLNGEIKLHSALELLGIKKTAFYKARGKFDEALGPIALLPNKRGRRGGDTQISAGAEEIISNAIKKIYKGRGTSYAKVWSEVSAQCTKLNMTPPSANSVRYRLKELGEKKLFNLKYGAEAAQQKYGAKPGKVNLSRPLQRVQMDHTRVDCFLCDDDDRLPLSRPWVTLIVDVHTRVILGFYVAFHGPSTLSVACAITHAVMPKNSYLKALECEYIPYPFFGVPELLHMDNAREFRTIKLQKACALHGITTEWRPMGRKHWGGHIERLIGTMMTSNVHFLPGTTMSNPKGRGNYDSEKKAAFTIKEFIKWFAGQVGIYNHSEHSALRCSPAEAWRKGFTDSKGILTYPPVISDAFKFRLDFMPEQLRSIRPIGVMLNRCAYWSPELKVHVGMKNVVIKFDPYSMYTIWAKINGEYIELHRSDLTADDFSYEEHVIANAGHHSRKAKGMNSSVMEIRENNEGLVTESIKKTKQAKKKREAKKAYFSHTSSQLLGEKASPADRTNTSNIDFTTIPEIYHSEEF